MFVQCFLTNGVRGILNKTVVVRNWTNHNININTLLFTDLFTIIFVNTLVYPQYTYKNIIATCLYDHYAALITKYINK